MALQLDLSSSSVSHILLCVCLKSFIIAYTFYLKIIMEKNDMISIIRM